IAEAVAHGVIEGDGAFELASPTGVAAGEGDDFRMVRIDERRRLQAIGRRGVVQVHSVKVMASGDSGPSKAARQCSPGATGQASVQVPVVTTSPGCRSVAPGQARKACRK